jgi:hypothetical protein
LERKGRKGGAHLLEVGVGEDGSAGAEPVELSVRQRKTLQLLKREENTEHGNGEGQRWKENVLLDRLLSERDDGADVVLVRVADLDGWLPAFFGGSDGAVRWEALVRGRKEKSRGKRERRTHYSCSFFGKFFASESALINTSSVASHSSGSGIFPSTAFSFSPALTASGHLGNGQLLTGCAGSGRQKEQVRVKIGEPCCVARTVEVE